MKFTLHFKTPDVLDQVTSEIEENIVDADIVENEEELIHLHNELNAIKKTASKFIEWNECISIEFDTATQTATVLPVN